MARGIPAQRDELAEVEAARGGVDLGSESLDDARALVADHERTGPWPLTVPDVEVGVADAAGQDPDPDLAMFRLIEDQLLDRDRLTRLFQDGGTHKSSVPDMTRPGAG